MKGEWTLVWEGDQASTASIEIDRTMVGHVGIAFELRNAAKTSGGWSALYTVPINIFKSIFTTTASPVERLMCSPYDNQYGYLQYLDDTHVQFTFATTSRLRRIWLID